MMEQWLSKAWDGIIQFTPGETITGAEIVSKLKRAIGSPPNSEGWAVALIEAEMGDKLIFDGKFAQDVECLPVNPIYKIPGTPSFDFWDAIKERTA